MYDVAGNFSLSETGQRVFGMGQTDTCVACSVYQASALLCTERPACHATWRVMRRGCSLYEHMAKYMTADAAAAHHFVKAAPSWECVFSPPHNEVTSAHLPVGHQCVQNIAPSRLTGRSKGTRDMLPTSRSSMPACCTSGSASVAGRVPAGTPSPPALPCPCCHKLVLSSF